MSTLHQLEHGQLDMMDVSFKLSDLNSATMIDIRTNDRIQISNHFSDFFLSTKDQ